MSRIYSDSSMVSRWYPMLCDLGYPQLDVIKYEDGEWCIIEYINAPLVPSLTKWQHVLRGMRNIEITEGFLKNYIRQIDPKNKHFWSREDTATQKMEEEKKSQEEFAEKKAADVSKILSKNDALMERFAKNGPIELDLRKLAEHIPQSQLKEMIKP